MEEDKNKVHSGVSRRKAVQVITLASTSLVLGAGVLEPSFGAPKAKLRFGIVTDSHYAERKPKGTRYFQGAKEKLEVCIQEFNSRALDFIIHLGDFKDQDVAADSSTTLDYLITIESVFQKFKGPKYHCVGNHDVDSITKEQFLQNAPNTSIESGKSYYSFDANNYHFVVLDANYDENGNDHFYLEGADWQNTNIPKEQLTWLEKDLTATNFPTVVFCHHPLYLFERDGNRYHVQNYRAVQSILETSRKVHLVFQGHVHESNIKKINGIHYITLLGMVDYEGLDNNAFNIVSLQDNECDIKGYARSKSQSLKV